LAAAPRATTVAPVTRQSLEGLTRDELVERAERLGVARPRVLTQAELIDEILGRTTTGRERARARGWLGRARDVVAGVIERGLHLPEVAKALRSTPADKRWPEPPPPLPTITLAEIYAAQGHLDRAVTVLDEVLAREPEHGEARALRERLVAQSAGGRRDGSSTRPPGRSARPPAQGGAVSAAPAAVLSDTPPPPSVVEPTTAAGEPALPERYDVDEVVAIAVDPTTLYVYWEVRPVTMARARARRTGGALALRVVSVTAGWDGPVSETRDLRVDALFGDMFIRDLPAGASVRVSIGWSATPVRSGTPAEFEPFAVGVEVSAPRAIALPPSEATSGARAEALGLWSATPGGALAGAPGGAAHGGHPAFGELTPGGGAPAAARAFRRLSGGARLENGPRSGPRAHAGGFGETETRHWGAPGPGGSSALSRRRARGGASDLVGGGASDLSRGS
jgi:hypothetical protein